MSKRKISKTWSAFLDAMTNSNINWSDYYDAVTEDAVATALMTIHKAFKDGKIYEA